MNTFHKVQYNNIYNVEWKKLVNWLTPVTLRKKKLLALLYALVSPINDLHTRFITYKKNIDYRLKINYQVCFLQAALNDRFDYTGRRIQIVRSRQFDPQPLFLLPENKPMVLNARPGTGKILYTKSETGQFTADFIIKIPASLQYDLSELTAFVNSYIVQCRTFKVQTY
ncbi:hypothetical protein SAMN05421788_101840 [Filimonas lacunae]|uniref:Uncharacterized protein n=1 Tax=Filimonas lacunae TaxID=477680 RepID=A0A173MP42_9BACT|nr:hypothetical protein [Filimonas lacunae]BAV09404.1 hypothetical protein FLA_5452 [Filimonas lacunae]SIS72529.1 hypothetical protein SAMN05421788_101840 [Filimonas lacunae]